MEMLIWVLCLLVLAAAAEENAKLGATLSARDGNLYLQTTSEFGSLFINGKNVVEYLGKVDDLVSLVAMVMQENKEIKVHGVITSGRVSHMPHRWKTQR
jgi:hypothetical protein